MGRAPGTGGVAAGPAFRGTPCGARVRLSPLSPDITERGRATLGTAESAVVVDVLDYDVLAQSRAQKAPGASPRTKAG